MSHSGRRNFLRHAWLGIAGGLAGGLALNAQEQSTAGNATAGPKPITDAGVTRLLTEQEKAARIASNSYPIRFNFKVRNPENDQKSQEMQKKCGTLTLL